MSYFRKLSPGFFVTRADRKTLISLLMGVLLSAACSCSSAPRSPAARSCQAACLSGNCSSGVGNYRYADCALYSGEFRGGVRHGKGSYEFPGKDVYRGQYRNGRRSGEGGYDFASGDTFLGGFASARFVAPDALRFADGAVLQGVFIARAAEREGWPSNADVPGIEAYGTLNRDGQERLCASFRRALLCETDDYPGRLLGTSLGTPARNRFLLVLYSDDVARINREGSSLAGRSGMLLRPGDRIQAGNHSVEIQTAGGTAIRLKPGSLLLIPADFARSGILDLKQGGILVRTGAADKKSRRKLRVRSGGTLYTVNGTEFSVETDESGRMSKVKVYSGEILLSPDVPALRRFSPAEIEATPALKKMIESIEQRPTKVGAGETAELNEKTRRWTGKLNQALERQTAEDDPTAALTRLIEEKPKEKGTPKKFTETPQERSERRLLTTIDSERFDKAVEDVQSKGSVSEDLSREIDAEFEANLNERADDLTGDLKGGQSADNLEDLRRIYSTLEVITFRDGKKKAGSIVAQVGGLLILHSTDGVFRTRIKEIRYVDLYHREDGESKGK